MARGPDFTPEGQSTDHQAGRQQAEQDHAELVVSGRWCDCTTIGRVSACASGLLGRTAADLVTLQLSLPPRSPDQDERFYENCMTL